MKIKPSPFWIVTLSLIVIKLAIHFLTSTSYELHRDEMLYFAMGDHLSFGYASTPPLIGFLAFITRILFGYSEFGIKFFPALVGAGSIYLIALMVKEFGGRWLAILIAGTSFLTAGAFLRSNSLFQPVSFDQFFWLLATYLVIRLINRQNLKLWLWIGLVFGLGFLNKYAIVFYGFAILCGLLISQHRRVLFSKYFLYGMGVSFLIALPNLIWQYEHNWPVIHHMTELQQTQLVNNTLSGFLIDQLLNCAAAGLIWVAGLMVLLAVPAEKKYRFIAYTFLILLAIIVLGRGKSYYTLGAYSMLFAAGGYVLEKYLSGKLVLVNYALLLSSVIGALLFLPMALPYASFARVEKLCDPETGIFPQRWEDGKIYPIPQDYADMTGWRELTDLVVDAYERIPESEKPACNIYAENYGQAGAINFYGEKYNLPEVISFHDSYLSWAPDSISNAPFIYINDEVGDMKDLFQSYPIVGRVENKYFRENGVMVLLCSQPKKHWTSFYAKKVKELKESYYK